MSDFIPGRTPIVIVGDDWGRHVSTLQHLFQRVIGSQPIIWVNSFGHRRPRLTAYDMRRAFEKIVAVAKPRTPPAAASTKPAPDQVINPLALPWHDVSAIVRFNSWSIARSIRQGLDRVAPGMRPLFVSATPAAFGLIGRLDEIASIYFCMDDYGQIHGTDRDLLEPLEHQMLGRVDAVVATAASLTIKRRPASGRTLHLPQGVNYDHFATPLGVPAELASLPRPILGFTGGVGPAVDFSLIHALSAAFPDGSVVLVGPEQQDMSEEPWPANIHFLGARPYQALPAYVQAFDVGLVPYVRNDWTKAVDPLKLLEYLAAGIPVVTTALPEAQKYSAVISIADGPEAYVAAVKEALALDSDVRRVARRGVASDNRWEERASTLLVYAADVAAHRDTRAP